MRNHLTKTSTRTALALVAAPTALLIASPALAATYHVGPGQKYTSLQEVADLVAPGDVVNLDGGATYSGEVVFKQSGTSAAKITIRGNRVGGRRPVIEGGEETLVVAADHYVLEGLDITGGSGFCLVHKGDDVTVRDTVVHDCPSQGILGTDSESGSLTLDYVEVHHCGNAVYEHQIYIATDESLHPGSVFRMQHCYVHDANGGNNVKSRAERNEIYYNWIEGALYHEIELIGPDGQDEGLAREDSDVVGNVFRKTRPFNVSRIGGDGTGQTYGRYRFAQNTFFMVAKSDAAFRVMDGIESVEMYNNVFYQEGGGATILSDSDAHWKSGHATIAGAGNWVMAGSRSVPESWTASVSGKDPGFSDLSVFDFRPSKSSVLIERGASVGASFSGHAFPSPLAAPLFQPPPRAIEAPGTAVPRPAAQARDIGAYAFLSGTASTPFGQSAGVAAGVGSAATTISVGATAVNDNTELSGFMACSTNPARLPSGGSALAAVGLALGLGVRQVRRARRGSRAQKHLHGHRS